LSKVVGAGVLVASLATLPLAMPASAQDGTLRILLRLLLVIKLFMKPVKLINKRTFDWGWIGLLGLVGLAGRLAKHRQETVVYKDSQGTNHLGTTERYRILRKRITLALERYRDPQETNRPRTDGTTNR